MPTITWRITSEDPNQRVSDGLADLGPRVKVAVHVTDEHARTLKAAGINVQAVTGWGIIDTGATRTAVDGTVARRAGLPSVGKSNSVSVNDTQEVRTYAGTVTIEANGLEIAIGSNEMQGLDLEKRLGIIALIGRDLLSAGVLVYNGTDSSFSLSI